MDPLDRHACEAFADVLCLDWGLERLVLDAGVLDGDEVRPAAKNGSAPVPRADETTAPCATQCLKPILHALLVSGSLPHLSIAGNRKLKPASFRLLGAYLRKVSEARAHNRG